jgi:hypothetical protein
MLNKRNEINVKYKYNILRSSWTYPEHSELGWHATEEVPHVAWFIY